MASLRSWLCLAMLLLAFSCNEARTPKALSNSGGTTRVEIAKQVLIGYVQRKEEMEWNIDSKRAAPGGPDPQHH
ncbi:hypothetical protein NL676_027135 [Syzygium grande]|nr:hypothetical protein NL676_027132 [Syzygium grande]KAI6690307.1 hypothetical protein NL676_027135 [Syzygium grande]